MCRIPFLLYRSFSSLSKSFLSPKSKALITAASFSGKIRYSRSFSRHFSSYRPLRTGHLSPPQAFICAFRSFPPIESVL